MPPDAWNMSKKQSKQVKHEKMNEKAIDGWFQVDYVLDLAKGTENHYIVIG
jgi:hypothetical protein